MNPKEKFFHCYLPIISSISSELKGIKGYQEMYGPHVPGVGDNYWEIVGKPKIAIVGCDVGVGQLIRDTFEDLHSFVQFYSTVMNEYHILTWNRGYGQFAGAAIFLLSTIYDINEDDLNNGKRNDILSSFVWAQSRSVWKKSAWKKVSPELSDDTWNIIHKICRPLDSIKLLIEATDCDIAIIMCWPLDGYLDVPYEVITNEHHLRLLKLKDINKYIIHTCHPRHWPDDFNSDPFYTRLNDIATLLKKEIKIEKFFA